MAKINLPQSQFLALPHKFRAYVGGYGSGKTWSGCCGIIQHLSKHPHITAGYFAPTYPQIRDIFYPTMEEVAEDWGFETQIKQSDKEVTLLKGGRVIGKIVCRSMDNPASIVGFKIGHALVDELDTMERRKASRVWKKIIARMRFNADGLKNGIDVVTTPEGFGFVYEQFIKAVANRPELASLYGIVQASTYKNRKNLPDDYINSLEQSYPPQLIKAYLNGEFVNLESGSVWDSFDRKLNHSDATMQAHETLHIGMDFNVLKMAAVVYVIRGEYAIAVDELVDVRDTPTIAGLIKEKYPSHKTVIYPDASGGNTSSKDASQSDLSILRQHGFSIRANRKNPAIKDRVNATNARLHNAKGERKLLVNTTACPTLTEALEQQAYDKNGMPDKTSGHDHVADAGTYPIVKLYPITKPTAQQRPLGII